MTDRNGKVTFGPMEWIGLLAAASAPTIGFICWVALLDRRMAVIESSHTQILTVLGKIDERTEKVPIIWDRLEHGTKMATKKGE